MKTQNSLSQEREDVSSREIFQQEMDFLAQGYDFVVGIDEAGRGPLAGPVVACATAVRNFQITNSKLQINSKIQNTNDEEFIKKINLIKDSKKLSEKRREELFGFIQDNFYVGVGICDHQTIDRINILEATYLAMKTAVTELVSSIKYDVSSMKNKDMIHNTKYIILVDGDKQIPNLSIEQRAIVGGDNFVKSISAASIIAKVTRDRMMKEAHIKFPQYNFLSHKGYGTKIHMEALKKFGPCEIHRRSFRPVREVEEMYRMMISN